MPNEAEGSCRRYRKARAVRAEFADRLIYDTNNINARYNNYKMRFMMSGTKRGMFIKNGIITYGANDNCYG